MSKGKSILSGLNFLRVILLKGVSFTKELIRSASAAVSLSTLCGALSISNFKILLSNIFLLSLSIDKNKSFKISFVSDIIFSSIIIACQINKIQLNIP